MATGTIKRLTDKGFGFISTGSGNDLFFHSSALEGVSYAELREGQTVTAGNGTAERPYQLPPPVVALRCQGTGCINLASQTRRTYTLDPNDLGRTVRVVVTAPTATAARRRGSAVTAASS